MKNIVRPNKEKRKKVLISEKNEYQGLCSCCVNLTVCTFLKNSRQPVLQCEEFDGDNRSTIEIAYESVSLTSHIPETRNTYSQEGGYVEKSHNGLCATCESRDNCIFPKQEGGVWRCEEYR